MRGLGQKALMAEAAAQVAALFQGMTKGFSSNETDEAVLASVISAGYTRP